LIRCKEESFLHRKRKDERELCHSQIRKLTRLGRITKEKNGRYTAPLCEDAEMTWQILKIEDPIGRSKNTVRKSLGNKHED